MATSTLKSIPTCGDVIKLINNNVISTPSSTNLYFCDNNGILSPYNGDTNTKVNKTDIFGIALVIMWADDMTRSSFVIGKTNIPYTVWTNNISHVSFLLGVHGNKVDDNCGMDNTETVVKEVSDTDNAFIRCYNTRGYFDSSVHGYLPGNAEVVFAQENKKNIMAALNLIGAESLFSDTGMYNYIMTSTLYDGNQFYVIGTSTDNYIGYRKYNETATSFILRPFFPVIL